MPYKIIDNVLIPVGSGGISFLNRLNAWFTALRDAIQAIHDDTALAIGGSIGNGRLVGSDTTAGRPVAGTGLSLNIPNGTRFIIDGAVYTANGVGGFAVITDVPANKPGGVYGYLSVKADGSLEVKDEHWFDSIPSTPPPGLPLLAEVVTGAASVLSVSYTSSEVVQSHPTVLARLAALEAAVSGAGEGGGGGGIGEVTQAELAAVQAQVTALLERIATLENATEDNVVAAPTESEIQQAELLRVTAFLVHAFPEISAKVVAGIEIPGIAGNAEDWTNGGTARVHYAGGNATRNPNTRRVE